MEEGKWMWTDGTPLANYTNWGHDSPNNYLDNQNCGIIMKGYKSFGYNDGVWNDNTCANTYGYICEKFST